MLKPRGSPDSAALTVPRSVSCAELSCVSASGTQQSMADARGESRTLMGLPPTDFESVASAIPPLGPSGRNLVDREGPPHLRPYACARDAADYAARRGPDENSGENIEALKVGTGLFR